MELWVRWSWLLLVLLCGPGFSSSQFRHRRQSDAWLRNYQPDRGSSRGLGQPVSGVGSSRGIGLPSSRVGPARGNPWSNSVSGLGALRGVQSVSRWDGRYNGRDNLRDLAQSSPISVQCGEAKMVVMVNRDFYGNGKLVKPTDLTLGSCRPGQQTTDTMVVFDNGLQECGNSLEMTLDWLIYTSNLHYAPTSSRNIPIIRSNSAVVPVQCFYPRHGNVSSNAIKPTWTPFSTTVTSDERLAFSLQLMTSDFSAPSSILVFRLGEMLFIEASLDIQNHVPMILFVDRCVATIMPDVNSRPSYDIISNNGCMIDSMEEDSSSGFVSPRPQANKLQFMVDAFRFTDSAVSTIYITCTLRAADINQIPDPMNKACSYNKASNSWSSVEGSSGICQCCTTRNCATAAGQRTQWGSSSGRQRGFGKRDVGSHLEKHGTATLGPILVTGSKSNQVTSAGTFQGSRMTADREPLQLWVLVIIGSVTSIVVAVALTVAGKCLLKRSHKESVQQWYKALLPPLPPCVCCFVVRMELWVSWSYLLVVFLYGPGFGSSLIRHQRQSDDWWRNSQPGQGSSRGLGQSVPGVGSSRRNPWSPAQSIPSWDSRYTGRYHNLRELSLYSPISVQCGEDRMVVMVNRDFYGNGKLVNPSDLTLGSCKPGARTTDSDVIFENGLQECGSALEMTPDWLIYTSLLRYSPTSSNVPITRSNPALIPILCYYPRHGNVSSNAIRPTWTPFSTTVTSEERLVFSLQLMTADFSAPTSVLVYTLGEMLYIEASLDIQNHVPMILFVDRCVATITPDVDSRPSYDIISNNGCMMDSMEEDSSSVFVSPRPQDEKLRFMVDAFRFTNSDVSLIYITCTLRAADINQTPDPMNKACSYNKASSSWSSVEGSSGICQCCTTRNCATAASQRTQWGSSSGRQRGFGKRNVGSHVEKHGTATLGPILVTGSKSNQVTGAGTLQASRMTADREPLQLWVLVAIGSVTSVVVAVALIVAGKCLLTRFSHKESV
ncbi:uncharacterized protein [Dendrobates tinctorius]|uniref:uncharacterized protein n=1 Tax=Dendrobates tinctorius TaxID=92724 RepID=UPI003CCA15E8